MASGSGNNNDQNESSDFQKRIDGINTEIDASDPNVEKIEITDGLYSKFIFLNVYNGKLKPPF